MRMLRVRKKFFWTAGILAVLVAVAGFAIANINNKVADAASNYQATITSTTPFSYNSGEDNSRVFNLSNGQHAYCAQHAKGDASGTVGSTDGPITITGSSDANYQLYFKILYLGKTFEPSNVGNFTSVEVARNWAITYALNFAYPGGTKKYGGSWAPYAAATELYNLASSSSLPDGENILYIYDLDRDGKATGRQVILAAEHTDIQYFSLTATKTWNDSYDGYPTDPDAIAARPDSVSFTISGSNGYTQTKSISNNGTDNWGTVSFDNLVPGVTYSISEVLTGSEGWGVLASDNCTGLSSTSENKNCTVTNKVKSAYYRKIWSDSDAENRPVTYYCLVDENGAIQYSFGCDRKTSTDTLDGEWYGLPLNHTYSVCELSATSYDNRVATCNNSTTGTHSVISGYTTSYAKQAAPSNDGFEEDQTIITNTKDETHLVVEKKWVDDNDFSSRPDYIYVCLTTESGNSKIIDSEHCVSLEVSKTGMIQAYTFEHLDLLDDGVQYGACEVTKSVYDTLQEGEDTVSCDETVSHLDNYTIAYSRTSSGQVNITNTKTEGVYVHVDKVWTDEGHESERPDQISVVIQGYINGVAVQGLTYNEIVSPAEGEDKTASDTWSASFGPYDKEHDDATVDYRVDEVNLGNSVYSKTITRLDGDEHNVNYEIRNSARYIPIKKLWLEYREDFYTAPDYRPESVTFALFRKTYGDPTYAQYKVYTVSLNSQDTTEGITLKRSSYRDWDIEIGPLPYYDDAGHEYDYKVEEQVVNPYTLDPNYTSGDMNGYVFANTTKMIEVDKWWDDQNNADGVRPDRVGINIVAKVDGVEVAEYSKTAADGYYEITVDDAVSYSPNMWIKKYGPFPKFDLQGNEIEYKAVEVLPDGSEYESSSPGMTSVYLKDSFMFTNTYRAKTAVKLVKHWGIGDALPASLPEIIHFTLYRNGEVDALHSDIAMYVGDEIQMDPPAGTSQNDMWRYAHVWSKDITDLDKYDNQGNEIVWTVSEWGISGYYGNVNCYASTGTYSRICDVTNVRQDTVKLNVYKEWLDDNDEPLSEEIARPRVVKFMIRRGITGVTPVTTYAEKTVVVTKDEQSGQWFGSVDELPRYDYAGREYEYDIWEIPAGPYTSNIEPFTNQNIQNGRDAEGNYYFSATNKLSDHTNIVVEKCWVDNDNRYKTRPAELHFDFITYLNGVKQGESEDFTLTAADLDEETGCWRGGKNDLPTQDATGGQYTYQLVEKDFTINSENEVGDGEAWYESQDASKTCNVEDEGYVCTFTNKLVGKISKSGTKTWLDGGNANVRPDTLELVNYQTLEGYAAALYSGRPTWTKNNDNTWTYTYADMPLFNNSGVRYSYRIEEKYSENDAKNGDKYVSQQTAQAGDFKNLLTGKVNYCGKKVWVDSEAPEDFRPERITVNLLRDGAQYKTATVTSTTPEGYAQLCDEQIDESGDVWYFVFANLDKYNDSGARYSYTLDENIESSENFSQYITKVVGNTITNTYDSKKTSMYVEKIWLNDEKDDRPGYIDVTLYRNGKEYDKIRLSEDAAGKWYYEWPKLDANYEWTVKEDYQIPDYYEGWYEYTSTVDGTYVKIYNQKIEDTPETGDRNILMYVISIFAVAAGGLFITRRVVSRR